MASDRENAIAGVLRSPSAVPVVVDIRCRGAQNECCLQTALGSTGDFIIFIHRNRERNHLNETAYLSQLRRKLRTGIPLLRAASGRKNHDVGYLEPDAERDRCSSRLEE